MFVIVYCLSPSFAPGWHGDDYWGSRGHGWAAPAKRKSGTSRGTFPPDRRGSATQHPHLLAVVCQRLGRSAQAITLFQQLLQEQPGALSCITIWAGRVTIVEGRLRPKSDRFLQQALRLQPAFAEAANDLGIASHHARRCERALAAHHQALALNRAVAAAWSNLDGLTRRQGQLDKAIRCYRQALTLEPQNVVTLNQLGQRVISGKARRRKRLTVRRSALRLRPDYTPRRARYG